MNRYVKWIAVVIVALLGITYAEYAWSYQGNYNVDVSIPVRADGSTPGSTEVSALAPTLDSNPTSFFEFWSRFTGSSADSGVGLFTLYSDFTAVHGGNFRHVQSRSFSLTSGESLTLSFHYKNVEPGLGSIHVYIIDLTSNTTVYDHVWSVTVG